VATFLSGIISESWWVLTEAAPWVLFGFLAAGIIRAFVHDETVARHLGGNDTRSVLKVSLIGIPLPLCSCGVLPTAVGLRHQGAGRGPAAAFMVSTPESGVDSIAITWALLDPVMTVFRPVAAFVTATLTGLAINRMPPEPPADDNADDADAENLDAGGDHRAGNRGADRGTATEAGSSEHDICGCGCEVGAAPTDQAPLGDRVRSGLRYAFGELLGDIGGLLLLGVLIAGTISWLIPAESLAGLPGGELIELLLMLLVGIPLYICATASTPIAAALVLKGLSPGAALVFLLAGPATNAATVTVFARHWGRRATVIYVAVIAVCALILGFALNRLYAWAGIDISRWIGEGSDAGIGLIGIISAILLLLLIGWEKIASRRNR